MKKFALLIAGCLSLGSLANGCGARAEVATEKALSKIDSLLGSMDVKRKKIELSMRALKQGVEGFQKAKIKAQVKHDQLERSLGPVNDKIASVDQSLKRLRGCLASDEPIEIAGKSYAPQEIQQMAQRVLKQRKRYAAQQNDFRRSQSSLQKVVTTLDQKRDEYIQRLCRLESQVAEIDSKTIALKAMKDASQAMGESEESLAGNVEQLEDNVNQLFADVESELLAEGERWDESSTDDEIDCIDAVIVATQNPTDMIAEIDKVLAEAK